VVPRVYLSLYNHDKLSEACNPLGASLYCKNQELLQKDKFKVELKVTFKN
jgi:hypothetical protein